MVSDPKGEKHNVVELAKVRKQMQTLRAKEAKDKEPLKDFKNKARTPAGSRNPAPKATKRGVWDYIQLILFLAMGAYMLQLCSGGGGLPGL